MDLSPLVLCVLLCTVGSADAGVKTGVRTAAGSQSVTLQPWLVGLTAVVGFLLIVFIILIAFRLFKDRKSKRALGYEKTMETDGCQIKETAM